MITIQLISYDQNFRQNFKYRYKSRYRVLCSGVLKHAIKNVRRSNIDITIIDLLHQKIRDEFLSSSKNLRKIFFSEFIFHAHDIQKYGKKILDHTSLLLITPQELAEDILEKVFRYPIQDNLWWNSGSSKKILASVLDIFLSKNIELLRLKRENFLVRAERDSISSLNDLSRYHSLPRHFVQKDEAAPFSFLIGESKSIRVCRDQIKTASKKSLPVVLLGNEGFEQEIIAYYIHSISKRSEKGFKLIDFSEIPKKLYDSAIFKNILSVPNKNEFPKLWTEKNIATVFMHRVELLSWEHQTTLMKFLQVLEIWNKKKKLKLRMIFSILKEPKELIDTGIFRQDLLNKISINIVRIPSIWERDHDIIFILDRYLNWYQKKNQKQVNISPQLKLDIANYFLKKSVHEVYSILDKWLSLSRQGIDDIEAFQIINKRMPSYPKIQEYRQTVNANFLREREDQEAPNLFSNSNLVNTFQPELESIEKMYIQHVLNSQEGNMAKVSRTLGISRKTLYRKVKNYHLTTEQSSG